MTNLGAATDADGKATVALYEEGWYVIGAYDLREDVQGDQAYDHTSGVTTIVPGEYHSMNAGALMRVHVLAPNAEQLAALKAGFLSTLDAAYGDRSPHDYSDENWTAFQAAYESARQAVEGAEAAAPAKAALDSGLSALAAVPRIDHAAILRDLRDCLSVLPTASEVAQGRLYSSDLSALERVLSIYAGMSEYQKGLVTVGERQWVEALRQAYEVSGNGADLPAPQAFSLTVADLSGDFPETYFVPVPSGGQAITSARRRERLSGLLFPAHCPPAGGKTTNAPSTT
jgi:hypothetical protein